MQEHADAELDDEEPVQWPGYTPPRSANRPKRISAKIVAVAHGSDPLLWARKKNRHGQDYPPVPRPAMPTYDPRDRRQWQAQVPPAPKLPQVPRTTYNSWYNVEAV